jgi:putative membrane protein
MSTIVGFLIDLVVSAVVIWIVGKLNLGLSVKSFGSAIIGAVVIALMAGMLNLLLASFGIAIGGGIIGATITLLTAALVLMISGIFVPGMSVKGFSGALLAAIAISIVSWFVNWMLSFFGF